MATASARTSGWEGEVLFGEHHESHAASAFYPSPFEEAAVLTMDGVGEWATSSIGVGRGSDARLLSRDAVSALARPAVLGVHLLHRLQGELRRVQGDGARAVRRAEVRRTSSATRSSTCRDDGSLWMNMEYFTFAHGPHDDRRRVRAPVRRPGAQPEAKLTQREMDLARSIQDVTEEIMLKMARHAQGDDGREEALPGGRRRAQLRRQRELLRGRIFDDIWIQPAAGDAGGAVGVGALRLAPPPRHAARERGAAPGLRGRPRDRSGSGACAAAAPRPSCPPPYADGMTGAFLGPSTLQKRSLRWLSSKGYPFRAVDPARAPPAPSRTSSPRARSSACCRAGWSSGRARSAAAASSATRARRDAVGDEPEDQVPRVVPPVRAVGAARGRRGVVRVRRRQPVHAPRAPTWRPRGGAR